MDVIKWISSQHRGVRFAYNTSVSNLVPFDKRLVRPGEVGNSIAWLVWHMARTEDFVINSVIRRTPQIFTAWSDRLGGDYRNGTGFSDDEVAGFDVDAAVLDSYWEAVADETTAWLKDVDPATLEDVTDIDSAVEGLPSLTGHLDSAMLDIWRGRKASYLLGAPIIAHGYMHVGEMIAIRGRLGIDGFI
ncbi:MAG: DinB family protein [Actinomycetota bacterium]